jgi:hypothetical protein
MYSALEDEERLRRVRPSFVILLLILLAVFGHYYRASMAEDEATHKRIDELRQRSGEERQ